MIDLDKIAHILNYPLFLDTHMYLLKLAGLVTIFSHSRRHMNVPYCKFETILNRQSKSDYIHTLRPMEIYIFFYFDK